MRDRPVIRDPVEGSQPEVAGVKPEGITLPVKGAPAHTAGASTLQLIRHGPAHRVAIQLAWQRLPGILAPYISPHVFPATGEIMPWTGLDHDDLYTAPGQLAGQDPARRAGA